MLLHALAGGLFCSLFHFINFFLNFDCYFLYLYQSSFRSSCRNYFYCLRTFSHHRPKTLTNYELKLFKIISSSAPPVRPVLTFIFIFRLNLFFFRKFEKLHRVARKGVTLRAGLSGHSHRN